MAEKLTVEADDSVAATLLDEVKKTVKVVEPDATVSEA
jgi:hypothetical protein